MKNPKNPRKSTRKEENRFFGRKTKKSDEETKKEKENPKKGKTLEKDKKMCNSTASTHDPGR